MEKLIIKNVGPIKNAELDLNKVNVFIGPQSSGKSTIAKVISYCKWFEKSIILGTNKGNHFLEDLIEFHNLEECYFHEDSLIEYTTNCFKLKYSRADSIKYERLKEKNGIYYNRKIEYIPAERNLVALSGITKYNEAKNNIWNFIFDWLQAKKNVDMDHQYVLPLETLDVQYYYDKENDNDYIVVLENDMKILLRHTSSGLLSVTPLLMVYDYVLKGIYEKDKILSPQEISSFPQLSISDEKLNEYLDIYTKKFSKVKNVEPIPNKYFDKISGWQDYKLKNLSNESLLKMQQEYIKTLQQSLSSLKQHLRQLSGTSYYHFSDIIVEEPESNLFPKTQYELVKYMIRSMNFERGDSLVLTTHSPYIMSSLNNLIEGDNALKAVEGKDMSEADKLKAKGEIHSIIEEQCALPYEYVSAWMVENGTIRSINDDEYRLISADALDSVSDVIGDEYNKLLDYE